MAFMDMKKGLADFINIWVYKLKVTVCNVSQEGRACVQVGRGESEWFLAKTG